MHKNYHAGGDAANGTVLPQYWQESNGLTHAWSGQTAATFWLSGLIWQRLRHVRQRISKHSQLSQLFRGWWHDDRVTTTGDSLTSFSMSDCPLRSTIGLVHTRDEHSYTQSEYSHTHRLSAPRTRGPVGAGRREKYRWKALSELYIYISARNHHMHMVSL